jgi:DNA-binding NtrC family response regulator
LARALNISGLVTVENCAFDSESGDYIAGGRGISSMTREKLPMPPVLVVDDEPLIRWSLSERLTDDGYPVLQASSGAEALAVLATVAGEPAIVLLDLRLPDVNDLTLFRRIRALRPDVPVILITAHGSAEDAAAAMAEGAYRVVTKPFDVARIAAIVHEARGHS